MAYRKLTIRRMKPVAREGAKILNDLDSIRRRMKNWLAKVEDIEMDARALDAMNRAKAARPAPADLDLGEGG
jgi:hypothetical protein